MAGSTRFLSACRRERTDRTPIWIMRQAGRYLPEYRALRSRHAMLEVCRTPSLACEATLQPMRRFALDAAILFSDLLIPIEAIGCGFDIVEGRGPVLDRPVRTREAIAGLNASPDLRTVDFTFEAVRMIKTALAKERPDASLIGFTGAPFTVASYIIEGGPSRRFHHTKLLMRSDPRAWASLMDRLADLLGAYLVGQIEAGADAVQVFDSWVGCLSPDEYRRHVLDPTRRVIAAASARGVPVIHFGTMNGTLIEAMAEAGGDVIGADWRMPLDQARARCPGRAVQGNLDPVALFAPQEVLSGMIDEVLAQAGGEPGHVFNLGHGIQPDTPVDSVRFLVEAVHDRTLRDAPAD